MTVADLRISHFVAVTFMVMWFFKGCEANKLRELYAEETTRADSIAIQATATRAEADGWQVTWADSVEDLTEQLAETEGSRGDLARDLLASRAEVRSLVSASAAVAGSLTDTVVIYDTVSGAASDTIDDGVLSGRWSWMPPVFNLDYRVGISGEIITTEGGDGRVLITARSLNPLATFSVDSVLFTPPAPRIEVRGPSWWIYPALIAGGYLVGVGTAR